MLNEKKIIIIIVPAIIFALLLVIWYTSPKQHTRVLQGISFALNNTQEEQKEIFIGGKVSKNLMGEKTFKGIIEVEGEELLIPSDDREVVIRFLDNGLGTIVYAGIDEESRKPYTYSYGIIFANDDFSQVVIIKENENENEEDWSLEDKTIIVAPADNRTEGIEIANKLMEEFLNGNSLK